MTPLLQPVSGTVGLVFAVISSVRPLREADRPDSRTAWPSLELSDLRGMPWPDQVGRDGLFRGSSNHAIPSGAGRLGAR